jgi:hypothetical protein
MWGLWWTKCHWGRFFPTTTVSPANSHSINFSIIIITRGWHNRSIGSRTIGLLVAAVPSGLNWIPAHYSNILNSISYFMHATCPTQIIFLDLINFAISVDNYKLRNSSLRNFDFLYTSPSFSSGEYFNRLLT